MSKSYTEINAGKWRRFFVCRMNENMEFPGISGDDIEWLQDQFVKSIKVRLLVDQNKTTNDYGKESNIYL
jgi:hypothetical protein